MATINKSLPNIVGYRRVSTVDQVTARQLDGVEVGVLFEDIGVSGSAFKRPQLDACLEYLRPGDTLVVHSIDRLARNVEHLHRIVRELIEREVTIRFHRDNLVFGPLAGESNPMADAMLGMLAVFAQFERALIKERQLEGIEKAKKKGTVYVGRKPRFNDEQEREIVQEWEADGMSIEAISVKWRAHRKTIERIIDKYFDRRAYRRIYVRKKRSD